VTKAFATSLASPAQVQWYADLPYDLLNVRRVREDLIGFLAGYRP